MIEVILLLNFIRFELSMFVKFIKTFYTDGMNIRKQGKLIYSSIWNIREVWWQVESGILILDSEPRCWANNINMP